MKKLVLLFIVLSVSLFILSGCTENSRAKSFGETATVDLPDGKTLLEATWKGDELWYLYRDRKDGEVPQRYVFQEESSFGMIEGKVIFLEH